MKAVQFRFLGPFDIRCGGRQLPRPPTLKSQSLLAYLVLHRGRPQPRSRLTGLSWGDRPQRKPRPSLATTLWYIRRALPGEHFIRSNLHTVQLDPRAAAWLDGFYDDWIVNEQYHLEALFAGALIQLIRGREQGSDDGAAPRAGARNGLVKSVCLLPLSIAVLRSTVAGGRESVKAWSDLRSGSTRRPTATPSSSWGPSKRSLGPACSISKRGPGRTTLPRWPAVHSRCRPRRAR